MTTKNNTSNNLIYKDSVTIGKERTTVKIRLNDECKTGHQDFAIVCDIYEHGRNVGGGAAHDHISKVFNGKYDDFIRLHLCDYAGIPTYAVENGFYHLKEGGEPMSKDKFCAYYRVSSSNYDILIKSEHKLEFALLLESLGILKDWKNEADAAIKRLEGLTGLIFLNDSKKSQYNAPEIDLVRDFESKVAAGYYDDDKKKARSIQTKADNKAKKIADLKAYAARKIDKIKTELAIDLFIVKKLGVDFNNHIYYNHKNTLTFNWKDYDKNLTEKEFDKFCESITENQFNSLPEGIEFELKGVKIYTKN